MLNINMILYGTVRYRYSFMVTVRYGTITVLRYSLCCCPAPLPEQIKWGNKSEVRELVFFLFFDTACCIWRIQCILTHV